MGTDFGLDFGLDFETEIDRSEIIKTAFGWPGGKLRSLDKILPHLPMEDGYVEPFGGSGAILLNRPPAKLECYNDRNSGVVDFYKCIRDEKKCKALDELLNYYIHSREEWTDCKNTWKNTEDPVERAAKWLYMIKYSFGSKGFSFGRSTYDQNSCSKKLASARDHFWKIHHRLKNVLIENQDWRQILKDFDKSNVTFYLDPPYLTAYKGTYEFEMSEAEHEQMLDMVMDLEGFAAVSSYPNELYDSYDWGDVIEWEVYCSIKGHAFREENNFGLQNQESMKREYAKEALYIKF